MNVALEKFKVNASIVLIASALIETVFFFSLENSFAILSLLGGWFLLITTTLTNENLKYYPVSFIMILGMAIFYYFLPLPLTLLDFKPVTFNMRVPFLTFFHHFLFVLTIVLTHKIYTIISNGNNIFRALLIKTNFYVQPTNPIIWKTALIGLIGSVANYFILGVWQMESQDRSLVYYINTAMSGYVWMPLIILFPKFRLYPSLNTEKAIKYIVIYSAIIFVIAIASNWRTILMSGIFMVVGLFGVGILFQHFTLRSVLTPKRLVLVVAAFLFVSGPLMDMALAMTIVRGERTELPALEFLIKTVEVYSDKDQIDAAKNASFNSSVLTNFDSYEWNESYLNNAILNRLSNLKISDNSLFYANEIGYQNKDMQDEMLNQILAFTPNVFLSFTNYDLDTKVSSSNYSIGDYLYGLAINSQDKLGGAVISSMPGVGMAIFGYWYLIIIIPLFLVIFTMFDSFVVIRKDKVIFSYFFFLMFLTSLNYFNDRHVFVFEFRFILRTYFESVLIFLLTMKIVNLLSFNPRQNHLGKK